MRIYVYEIYFPSSDKYYIGQTNNLRRRLLRDHLNSGNLVCRALYKYTDWKVSILYTCKTRDEANRIEIEEITKHDCQIPKGYNQTSGGENPPILYGDKNPMRRPEIVAKVSRALKGRKCSEEHKKAMRKPKPGLSKIMLGNKNGIKSQFSPGHKPSKSTRIKMAIARTQYHLNKLEAELKEAGNGKNDRLHEN